MRIYVAGPGSDWRSSATLIENLECEGHTITHRWPDEFAKRERGETVPPGPVLVANDLTGVRAADVVVLNLGWDYATEGAWVEWGVAHEAGKILIAYLHGAPREAWKERIESRSIFLDLPGNCYRSYSEGDLFELLASLERLEQERRAA